MSHSTSGESTDVAAIKIVRWETIQWLWRLYNGTEVVSDAFCNFFLNTTSEMHNGHELLYLKSGLPRIIISGLLCTRPKRPTQWNYSVLVWDAGKPYRVQTWPEDRGYTVCSNDVIICDCVNCRFHMNFVLYPYVYIAPKWSLFANSVTYIYIILDIIIVII